MTSVHTLRPPLQPTLKAASTAQSSQLLAVAGPTPAASRSSSQVRQGRPAWEEATNHDFLSEKATLSLIKRVLVADGTDLRGPSQPVESVLPPLTSSNEVDVQLYAIIAIVIRGFVDTWYSKITPDHAFVEEVIQIIAHCTRAIEQRLRQIDIVELILDEIPAMMQQHVEGMNRTPEEDSARTNTSVQRTGHHMRIYPMGPNQPFESTTFLTLTQHWTPASRPMSNSNCEQPIDNSLSKVFWRPYCLRKTCKIHLYACL